MKITAIAAVGRNWELGRNNDLIWKMPEDMRHFKQTTEHHAVLMGRKTYESIGKPLPNRRNYILASGGSIFTTEWNRVGSIEVALENAERSMVDHLFVIGGAQVYKQVIESALCHEIILTYIHDTAADADTFFPTWTASPITSMSTANR
ncbi:dihydrofolate reductase [Vreelandella sulfidaeris]|uniref:dihydrofolate reductase n=1 Tax=Vreelandella sulfidaeris TaxID=115553 RepID=A0A455U879_9GAMM|nr:dihydrofolate reductase [Halomonas sulfidaeris]